MSSDLRAGLGAGALSALFRPGFSALVGLGAIAARGGLGEIARAWRRGRLLLVGVMAAGLAANIPVVLGLKAGDVSTREVLARTDLLFALVIGRLVFGERIGPLPGLGLVLMAAGTVLEAGVTGLGGLLDPGRLASNGWFILSAFGISVNAVFIKSLLGRGVRPDVIFVFNMASVTAGSIALALLQGAPTPSGARAAAWMLAAGALNYLALEWYYRSLGPLPIWLSRATSLISPLAALGVGALLGEATGPAKLAGMALVLAGAGLVIAGAAPSHPSAVRTATGAAPAAVPPQG